MSPAALLVVVVLAGAGCGETDPAPPRTVTQGDPARGRAAIERYGCTSCHVVPGIRVAEERWVGPPLTKYGRRSYVAGVLPNNEENLARWIMDPQEVDPRTAMPDLDVGPVEARDIVAYLYSQR